MNAAYLYWFTGAALAATAYAIAQLNTTRKQTMATQEQVDALTQQVNTLDTVVTKVILEVKTAIDTQAVLVAEVIDLRAQLDAGNTVDLTALEAAVANVGTAIANVDALIPDTDPTPVDPPVGG